MEALGKYMTVVEVHNPGRKTRRWRICNRRGPMLGIVEWYGAWRQYVFVPHTESGDGIFNAGCLSDIEAFLRQETRRQLLHVPDATVRAANGGRPAPEGEGDHAPSQRDRPDA